MPRIVACLIVALGAAIAGPVPGQSFDLAAAERELDTMFARPAGTPIAEEQKQRLGEFLKRHEGRDLAHLGYARALSFYFARDPLGGAAALDEFFVRHTRIANAEHATMAGRIYLMAMREESRRTSPAPATLQRWAERTTALYPDLATVARVAASAGANLADRPSFRIALVRGLQQSSASDADKDGFLAALYADPGAGSTAPGGPGKDVVTAMPVAVRQATTVPRASAGGEAAGTLQPGSSPPDLPMEHTLQAKPGFRLADLQGKVVVLDFFATWCPPCRDGVTALRDLQQKHAGALQVVGITRFYGRGMDFAPTDKKPHGGRKAEDLTREAEIEVNTRFAAAFGLTYPIVFTTEQAHKEAWGAAAIPTTVVLGKDGRVLVRITGNGAEEMQTLQETVARALR